MKFITTFMKFGIYLLFVSIGVSAYSQHQPNKRMKTVALSDSIIKLDSISILPGTMVIRNSANDSLIAADNYSIDYITAILHWHKSPLPDSLTLTYLLLPIRLDKTYFLKDTNMINRSPEMILNPFAYQPTKGETALFDFGDLDYNGSFSRGISFGNAQNVVLNSNFNLQLSGKLTEDIELVAVMTDNNLPIQPDGNTQQIQDFDKVFIQLKNKQNKLTAGDFELTRPASHFMNYQKKLQGIRLEGSLPLRKRNSLAVDAGVAVSKGQYARMSFSGEEGNQGPYKLLGNNGETFIIVLAGTERVYIDGELLSRGTDLDYTIDYNIGEIQFTPSRMITKDSRIQVEFEYSVQYYFRSLINASATYITPKVKAGFRIYSEQDAKNQPVLQSLDSARLDLLSQVGDSLSQAFFPGYEEVEFSEQQVLYQKTDSTVNSVIYSPVFIYSSNTDSARYKVSFSFVGEGKGNYVISANTVNGRVYVWVAPVNGIPAGNYEPVIQLVAPERKRMATVNLEYKPAKGYQIKTEIAGSEADVNTFSSVGNTDNKGIGIMVSYVGNSKLNASESKPKSLLTAFNYEFKGQQFRPLENYRPIEFQRDWNISNTRGHQDEHLLSADVAFQSANHSSLGYNISSLLQSGGYKGLRQAIFLKHNKGANYLSVKGDYLKSEDHARQSTFYRPMADYRRKIGFLPGWSTGFYAALEDNRLSAPASDSMLDGSFSFYIARIFLGLADSSANQFRVDFSQRKDKLPNDGILQNGSLSNTLNIRGGLLKNPRNTLRWNIAYRQLEIIDTTVSKQKPEESLLGRIDYGLSLWKGFIRSNTFFEVGSGQEQKREYTFVEVPVGQGTHVWNDDGDGIQELDEFEIASSNDVLFADFLKILTPTNEYIRTHSTSFNEILQISPPVLLRQGKKGNFLSRFSNMTTFHIDKKVLSGNLEAAINPFEQDIADSILISINSHARNTLYFNKTNPVFAVDYTLQDLRNKILLTNGPESRQKINHDIRIRWNIIESLQLGFYASSGNKSIASTGISSRNYDFRFRLLEPRITLQQSSRFRMSLYYLYDHKTNKPEFGNQQSELHKATLEIRYNKLSKSSLQAKMSFASVTYNGNIKESVAYAMLEGLQPGDNYLWAIGYEKTIAKNLQLSLSYDGRKTGSKSIVHVGRAQVRAIF